MRLPSWLCFTCFLENTCSAFKPDESKKLPSFLALVGGDLRRTSDKCWVTIKVPGHWPPIVFTHGTFCCITKSKSDFTIQERVKCRGRRGPSQKDRHRLTPTVPHPRICLAQLLLLRQVPSLPGSLHNLNQNSILLQKTAELRLFPILNSHNLRKKWSV